MKSFIKLILILILTCNVNAQVGIGTTTPEGALDIVSGTIDGLLIPRVALTSLTDVTGVVTPTQSEMVYNTTVDITENLELGYYYLASDMGPWVKLGGASAPPPPPPPPVDSWLITGNDNIVEGTNFLGTLAGTNVDVVFRRNGVESGRLSRNNTSFGAGALPTNNADAWNTAVGTDALGSITSGSSNVAIGHKALEDVTSGGQSVAIGFTALANSLGQWNVAVGYQAMWNLDRAAAQDNVAVGHQAMDFADNLANRNVGIGKWALRNVGRTSATGGTRNIAIGYNAGSVINAGTNNIIIGYEAQPSGAGAINEIVVGGGAFGSQTALVNANLGWANTSDRKLKTDIKDSPLGLDFIKTIRPVVYHRKNDSEQKTEFGFIAQELETALNTSGFNNTGIVIKTANDILAVHYNAFIPMTVKAVQEQQVLIEKLKKDNEELKAVNAEILKRLEALEKK